MYLCPTIRAEAQNNLLDGHMCILLKERACIAVFIEEEDIGERVCSLDPFIIQVLALPLTCGKYFFHNPNP